MMKIFKKQFITVALSGIALLMSGFVNSYAVCSFNLLNGGQIYANPGSGTGGHIANVFGCAAGIYTIQVSQSGAFNLQNLQVAVNGSVVANPSIVFINSGNNQIYVTGIVPNGTACGQTCTVNLWLGGSGGSTAATNNFLFKTPSTPSLSVSGPLVTCNLTPQTYTINVPGGCTNCTYTWNSLDPSWQINGSSTWPTNTTSASASISPTVIGSTTNLTVSVSGSNICGSPVYTLQDLNSFTPTLALTPSATCTGSGGTVTINATSFAGATYSWQSKLSTSTVWSTMGGATSSSISPSVVTTPTADILRDYRAMVTTSSGCVGPWSASVRIRWCKNNGVYCCIEKREGLGASDAEGILKVYPNPSKGIFHVALDNFETSLNRIVIKDIGGRIVRDIVAAGNEHQTEINLAENDNGIYMLEITDSENNIHQSKIVVQK